MSFYYKNLIDLCIKNNFTISLAESCTGGMIASNLISISGASKVIDFGLVTYSNNSKKKLLNIPKMKINKYGAVSQEIAQFMVEGLLKKTDSNILIGVTGIAGPNGGTHEKPVGLVYHSFYFRENNELIIKKNFFNGNRTNIRKDASNFTVEFIYKKLISFI